MWEKNVVKPIIFATVILLILCICCNKERDTNLQEKLSNIEWTKASKQISQYGTRDVDSFILNKIKKHRIVMVGDGGHHERIFQQRIISSLNRWINEISGFTQKDDDLPHELVLILEHEGNPYFINSCLKKFIRTGNAREILDNYGALSLLSTADIEFYYDLHDLGQRIDSLNNAMAPKPAITFNIFDPEQEIDFDTLTSEKRDDFYVKGRDEYSVNQIVNYLQIHSQSKAIIYYGNAHLYRDKAVKINEPTKRYGFFMAHYLKKVCGLDFYTIAQYGMPFIKLNVIFPTAYEVEISKTASFNKKMFLFDTSYSDGAILYSPYKQEVGIICNIPSRNVFEPLLVNFGNLRHKKNLLYDKWSTFSLLFLYILSGEEIPQTLKNTSFSIEVKNLEYDKWKLRLGSFKEDGVTTIRDLLLLKPYIIALEKAKDDQSKKIALRNMMQIFSTFFPAIPVISSDNPTEWKKHIQKYREEIIIPKLINFLWIGTTNEKNEALEALKEETGQNLESAKEWTIWWREKSSNVTKIDQIIP